MSTIATLNVAVTATNDDFINKMKKSGEHTEEFSGHMLTSRHSLQAFSGIVGTSAGALGHLVHSFEALPGPIGIAIGVLFALREAYNSISEAAKASAEVQIKAAETIKNSLKAAGDIKTFDGLAKGADDEIEKIETAIKNLNIDIGKNINSLNPFGGANASKDRDKIDALEDEERRWVTLRHTLDDFQGTMEKLNREKIKIEIDGGDKFDILQAQAKLLQETLPDVFDPKATKAMQRELDGINKELATMDRSSNVKVAERLKREADEIGKVNQEIAKQFESSVAADAKAMSEMQHSADKIREGLESPSEKFMENIKKAVELFEAGVLDAGSLTKYLNKQGDGLETKDHEVGASQSFRQIDASRISAAGLAQTGKKQIVNDPETLAAIKEGNALVVAAIKEKSPAATVAKG